MKNTVKILGIIALVVIIVFTMSACSGRNEGGNQRAEQKAADNLFQALESGDTDALQNLLSNAGSGIFAMLSSKSSPGGDFTYQLWDFESGQGIYITRYTGKGGVVIVPAEIEGYPVKGLDNGTFLAPGVISNTWYDGNDSHISAVILPDSIEVIGNFTFANRTDMHTINLPANLISMGLEDRWGYTFFGCTNLFNLIIPENLQSINFLGEDWRSRFFQGCGKLPLRTRQRIQELGYAGSF